MYTGVKYLLNTKSLHLKQVFKKKPWQARMLYKGIRWKGPARETEREAAIDYDKKRIELGLDPVNILKPLQ